MQLTVGKLKEWIERYNLPDDAKVFYQRIEDIYFEKHGWKTIEKPDAFIGGTTKYIDAFSAVKYSKDNNLYIDAHY